MGCSAHSFVCVLPVFACLFNCVREYHGLCVYTPRARTPRWLHVCLRSSSVVCPRFARMNTNWAGFLVARDAVTSTIL